MRLMKIGLIGRGMVGGAIEKSFKRRGMLDYSYDIKDEDDCRIEMYSSCDVIFVCVGTPTADGIQDLSQVYSVLDHMVDKYSGVVILKSTVLPGTTAGLSLEYGLRIVHNPEFLRERCAYDDFENQKSILLGGAEDDVETAASVYTRWNSVIPIRKMRSEETELVKYMHNVFLASKVAIFNEFYDYAQSIPGRDIDFKKVVNDLLFATYNISPNHTTVPGPDGKFGYGGACLVPGTKVYAGGISKNIEELVVDDEIDDGEDERNYVVKIGRRYVDSLISIYGRGRSLIGSVDHIHYTYNNGAIEAKLLKDFTVDDWFLVKSPKPIENYKIILGKVPNGYVKVWRDEILWDSKLAYLIGLWLADGSSNKNDKYSLSWSLGLKKEEAMNKVVECLKSLGLNPLVRYSESMGTYGLSKLNTVRVRSLWLYEVFRKLGVLGLSHTKKFPLCPTEFVPDIVGGWLDGDGSYHDSTISGYSESMELINGLDSALLSVGICAGIAKQGRELRISTRKEVARVCEWTTRMKFRNNYVSEILYKSPNLLMVGGGMFAIKVSRVNRLNGGLVISVETSSGKYLANNMLTHNCFPKDTMALLADYKDVGMTNSILERVIEVNKVYRGE